VGEKMNNYINLFKQWLFGIILLILSPFLILLGIILSVVFDFVVHALMNFGSNIGKKKNE
jgi:Na+-driven multidrug efflux pump